MVHVEVAVGTSLILPVDQGPLAAGDKFVSSGALARLMQIVGRLRVRALVSGLGRSTRHVERSRHVDRSP